MTTLADLRTVLPGPFGTTLTIEPYQLASRLDSDERPYIDSVKFTLKHEGPSGQGVEVSHLMPVSIWDAGIVPADLLAATMRTLVTALLEAAGSTLGARALAHVERIVEEVSS